MYSVYHNSRFVTRLYCNDDSISEKQKQLHVAIKSYNAYRSCAIQYKDVVVVKDDDCKKYEPLVKISVFSEFEHFKELKKRIEELPYPKGLQVKVEIPIESTRMSDKLSEKIRDKMLLVQKNNVKIFFDQEHDQFARQVAKWLLISDELNIKCSYKSDDRIVLECGCNNAELTKQQRWGPLYIPNDEKVNQFTASSNCEIHVWQQFKWLSYFTDKVKGVTIPVHGPSNIENTGLQTVQLRYTLRNGDRYDEEKSLCKLSDYILNNVTIEGYIISELSRGWIYQPPQSKFYLIVLDVKPRSPQPPQPPQQQSSELDSLKIDIFADTHMPMKSLV